PGMAVLLAAAMPALAGRYEADLIREDGQWKILPRVDYSIMPPAEEWMKFIRERKAADNESYTLRTGHETQPVARPPLRADASCPGPEQHRCADRRTNRTRRKAGRRACGQETATGFRLLRRSGSLERSGRLVHR